MIEIEHNYDTFKHYLSSYIKRGGIATFLKWIDTTDMHQAPASTKYHLSCQGGLVQHSLNVFNNLIGLVNMYYKDMENCPYTKESIALVALLHDISKVNYYAQFFRNVKNEQTGIWEQTPYYAVRNDADAIFFGSHEENSVYILSKFFKLTWDEEIAIRYHMGNVESTDGFANSRMYTAYKECPLALLLHTADLMAICTETNDGSIGDDSSSFYDIQNFIEDVEKNESDIKITDSKTDDSTPF